MSGSKAFCFFFSKKKFFLLLFFAFPASAADFTTPRDRVSLVSYADSYAPGQTLRLGLRFVLTPGWHTYWSNSGDAGAPPTIDLALPHGPLTFPAPAVLRDGPLISYVYTGSVLLPFTVSPVGTGPVTIAAHATWLVCANVCVPEEADFRLVLPVGAGVPGRDAGLFAAADAAMPRPSPFPAHLAADGTLMFSGLDPASVRRVEFVPDAAGQIDQDAPQKRADAAGSVGLRLVLAHGWAPSAGIAGVLLVTDAGGQASALHVTAAPGAPAPAAPAAAAPGLLEALLLAFAGGLILNLMPCVLPVLAMKAMAIARLSGAARAEVRREAGMTTAGILTAFLALGAATLFLHGGWGVQFQSPVFTALTAWLLFAIGLNLSGVFEVGTSLAGAGQGFAARSSFATGLLAVVVATPCTVPFMGAALAASVALPAAAGMAVFFMLGLGLAFPYVLFALVPRAAGWLPRPGAWMEVLRQAMAFPMYASALWLVWVVSQQAQNALVPALAGGLLVGFAGWAWGRSQGDAGRGGARAFRVAAVLGLALAVAAVTALGGPGAAVAARSPGTEPYSAARLAALRASHIPVFVDMSAAWCMTCLVNERLALDRPEVVAAFARARVVSLRGDWTRRDPAISAYLAAHDRQGVPFYAFYGRDGGEHILPQILTPGLVLAAIGQSPP